jgi:hypothetical protein
MLNPIDVGTILSKVLYVPIHHPLNMSKCDFCGQNDHATKLTSRLLKMSRCNFCGMIILLAKIMSIQVEKMVNDCQQDCFAGNRPTSTQIRIVRSTG